MKNVWLIYNPTAGNNLKSTLEAIDDAVSEGGGKIQGMTRFPDQSLPELKDLRNVDTVVVAAGDGTINAASSALDNWPGRLLVLPCGTMNMLPRLLHGTSDSKTILHDATTALSESLPIVMTADHQALVGVLIGPAAMWVHTREAVRKGKWHQLGRALRLAWLRSFSHSIRIVENGRRSRAYRAIYVAPDGNRLRVVKISARGFRQGISVGWHWMRGDVSVATGVTEERLDALVLAVTRPTFALFDGEPTYLPAGARLNPGCTRVEFVTTAR